MIEGVTDGYLLKALEQMSSNDKQQRLQGRIMQKVGVAILETYLSETERYQDSRVVTGALLSVAMDMVVRLTVHSCTEGKETELRTGLLKAFGDSIDRALKDRSAFMAGGMRQMSDQI